MASGRTMPSGCVPRSVRRQSPVDRQPCGTSADRRQPRRTRAMPPSARHAMRCFSANAREGEVPGCSPCRRLAVGPRERPIRWPRRCHLGHRATQESAFAPVHRPPAHAQCPAARCQCRAQPVRHGGRPSFAGCRWTRRARAADAARIVGCARRASRRQRLWDPCAMQAVSACSWWVRPSSEHQPENDQRKSRYAQKPCNEILAHDVSPSPCLSGLSRSRTG